MTGPKVVPALGEPPPPEAIGEAAHALKAGQLVALPTDTVYGLAVDPFHTGATDRLYAAKRRPRQVDLPVLVADLEQALALVIGLTDAARRLMERFWPGALTLVLPRRPDIQADLGSAEALARVEALYERAQEIQVQEDVEKLSSPLDGNELMEIFGGRPGPWIGRVKDYLLGLVLDGGPCARSPSTVVDCTGVEPRLLREGRIPWAGVVAATAGR